jgi:hypothetical protein
VLAVAARAVEKSEERSAACAPRFAIASRIADEHAPRRCEIRGARDAIPYQDSHRPAAIYDHNLTGDEGCP